jgi:hypothetical protein
MKIETAIKRVMENQKLDKEIKRLKLYSLGFKTMPGSINQGKVLKALEGLAAGGGN